MRREEKFVFQCSINLINTRWKNPIKTEKNWYVSQGDILKTMRILKLKN